MTKQAKRILTILAVVLLIFLLYNIFWATTVYLKYRGYVSEMEELYPLRTYVINEKDGYTYNAKIPDYLSFTGNLCVRPFESDDTSLLIWPGIFEETEYKMTFTTDEGLKFSAAFSEDGLPKSDTPELVKQKIEENRSAIDELFRAAYDMWDIE